MLTQVNKNSIEIITGTLYHQPMEMDNSRVRKIWNQNQFPVILRRDKGKLRLRLPYSAGNQNWMQENGGHTPEWISDQRYWEVPRRWLNDLVKRALDKYEKLYIIQPFREQEVCAPNCWNALGHDCNCSCMGENHGQGKMGSWLVVSDTFATRWHDSVFACRLLSKK